MHARVTPKPVTPSYTSRLRFGGLFLDRRRAPLRVESNYAISLWIADVISENRGTCMPIFTLIEKVGNAVTMKYIIA